MNRLALVLLLALSEASSPSLRLEVHAKDGRVTVRAKAVPLEEVLKRLCHQTGAQLVYDGPRPSPPVTVTIENLPESEMAIRILEGLGLNYAYQMDPSGRRVEKIFVGDAFDSEGTRSARNPGARRSRELAPASPPEEVPGSDGLEAPAVDAPDGRLDQPPQFPADASSPLPQPLFPR